jgi:hypothetical protein
MSSKIAFNPTPLSSVTAFILVVGKTAYVCSLSINKD